MPDPETPLEERQRRIVAHIHEIYVGERVPFTYDPEAEVGLLALADRAVAMNDAAEPLSIDEQIEYMVSDVLAFGEAWDSVLMPKED
jgi:hypothetical protein